MKPFICKNHIRYCKGTLLVVIYFCIFCQGLSHGVQHRRISVDNFFRIFEIIIFCFDVAICDLMHGVWAMHGLP